MEFNGDGQYGEDVESTGERIDVYYKQGRLFYVRCKHIHAFLLSRYAASSTHRFGHTHYKSYHHPPGPLEAHFLFHHTSLHQERIQDLEQGGA